MITYNFVPSSIKGLFICCRKYDGIMDYIHNPVRASEKESLLSYKLLNAFLIKFIKVSDATLLGAYNKERWVCNSKCKNAHSIIVDSTCYSQ